MTDRTVYFRKPANPSWVRLGVFPFSMNSRDVINRAIPGLIKPRKTVAPACIPGVLLNMSTEIPRKKHSPSKKYPGIVNGSKRKNINIRIDKPAELDIIQNKYLDQNQRYKHNRIFPKVLYHSVMLFDSSFISSVCFVF